MPVRMSSEKFIRAERKNRLENHRLKITCKHYDRETVRMNYDIDREKRSITKSFKTVVKTSGASDLGVPPKDENDHDFEKCPTYMQGLKLSSKRLLEWRECERQLNKFIENHELERIKARRKKVLTSGKDEYKVIPPRQLDDYDEDDVFFDDTSSSAYSEKTSPVEQLSEDKNEKFDIKKWESDLIESYKSSVCNHSAGDQNGDTKSKLCSKSSPAITTHANGEQENGTVKRVRPHTAQGRLRPPSGRSSVRRRPSSAVTEKNENNAKFLITKQSTFIKTGQHFEKLLDNRPVDKPLMVNNYLSTLKPPPCNSGAEKEPSIASVGTLCPVEEANEDDEDEADGEYETTSSGHSEMTNEIADDIKRYGKKSHIRQGSADPSSVQLSTKFQRQLMKKLQRARSASMPMTPQSQPLNNRNSFKHSNSDLSSLLNGSSRRSRRDSGSASSLVSMPMSRTGSIVSSHRPSISLGIPADIDEISRGQDKLASEISAEKPLSTNKLVCVSKIVRAAMTFSRLSRKRALTKMQNENSSDAHEIIRQERMRKLQSRQQVLNTIASQWQRSHDEVTIEQVE